MKRRLKHLILLLVAMTTCSTTMWAHIKPDGTFGLTLNDIITFPDPGPDLYENAVHVNQEGFYVDKGHGDYKTWQNGHLVTTTTSNNWVNIFTFQLARDKNKGGVNSDDKVNVPNGLTGDYYSGIKFNASGTAFRIIVYYWDETAGDEKSEIYLVSPVPNGEQTLSWSDLGVSLDKLPYLTRVCFAGTQETVKKEDGVNYTADVTFNSASMRHAVNKKAYGLDSDTDLGRGNVTWTVGNGTARLQSTGSSYNYVNVFNFPALGLGKTVNAPLRADAYSGIYMKVKGSSFRILIYMKDGTTTYSKRIKPSPGYEEGKSEGTEKERFFRWEYLGVPSDQIKNITKVCVAGHNDQTIGADETYNVDATFSALELRYATSEKGSNCIAWFYDDAGENSFAQMVTRGTSNNWISLLTDRATNNLLDASSYDALKLVSSGERFRIVVDVYKNGNTVQYTNYVAKQPNKNTLYIYWSEFKNGDTRMTTSDAALIKRIALAGDGYAEKEDIVYIYEAALVADGAIMQIPAVVPTSKSYLDAVTDGTYGDITWTTVDDVRQFSTTSSTNNVSWLCQFAGTGNNIAAHSTDNTFHSAIEYDGVYVKSKIGNDASTSTYRVLAHTTDGKTFIRTVNTSKRGEMKYLAWDEFKIQWGSTPMTPTDVARIDKVGIGGNISGQVENVYDFRLFAWDDIVLNLQTARLNNNAGGGASNRPWEPGWTWDNVKECGVYNTQSDVNNVFTLFDFGTNGNAVDYKPNIGSIIDGVRVQSSGARYRVVLKTSNKTFVKYIDASESVETTHIPWEDFKEFLNGNLTATTLSIADDLPNITSIGIAGDNASANEDYVNLYDIRLCKGNNMTFSTHGEIAGAYEAPNYNYYFNTPYGVITMSILNASTDDRDEEDKCVKLIEGRQYRFTPPAGYRIKRMSLNFRETGVCTASTGGYYVQFDGETGYDHADGSPNAYSVEYINKIGTNDVLMKYPMNHDPSDVKHLVSVSFSLESVNETDEEITLASGRKYRLYIPESSNGKKSPLVISLHGRSGNMRDPNVNFNTLAYQEGILVAYGQGGSLNGMSGWQAVGNANDDTQYLLDVIASVKAKVGANNIDEDRIYLCGYSMGGMMTYAAANVLADKFAAYASVSGFPLNEFHLRHTTHPVPFMHVHGTSDGYVDVKHISNIVDNMIYRNGASLVPTYTRALSANASNTPKATNEYIYGGGSDAATKYGSDLTPVYAYYIVDGMGHDATFHIDGMNESEFFWNFFKTKRLKKYGSQEPITYFHAEGFNTDAPETSHGWTLADGTKQEEDGKGTLQTKAYKYYKYGESLGSADPAAGQTYNNYHKNTYHSVQLKAGQRYQLKFMAVNTDHERHVTLRLRQIGKLKEEFNLNQGGDAGAWSDEVRASFAPVKCNEYVAFKQRNIDKNNPDLDLTQIDYYTNGKESVAPFTLPEDAEYPIGEYEIIIERDQSTDNTTLDYVEIVSGGEWDGYSTNRKEEGNVTEFTGFFPFHERLSAQWNFDFCDNLNFEVDKLDPEYWEVDASNVSATPDGNGFYGYKNYFFKRDKLSVTESTQLTYDGNHIVPITAGLRFKLTNSDDANQKVGIRIPCIDDKGEHPDDVKWDADELPTYVKRLDGGKIDTGKRLYLGEGMIITIPHVTNSYKTVKSAQEGKETPTDEGSDPAWFETSQHRRRDIVYFSLGGANDGKIWDNIDNKGNWLFRAGGEEVHDGKKYYKCDFNQAPNADGNCSPCEVKITQATTFHRIAVNRNLTASFYSENIFDYGINDITPGMRIAISPQGQVVANVGSSYAQYRNAIAMTYGGWKGNKNQYTDYNNNVITDDWGQIDVLDASDKHNDAGQEDNVNGYMPIPANGFRVHSNAAYTATSESLMPSSLVTAADPYHPLSEGRFFAPTADKPAMPNVTPWSLPARGASVKFELAYPGVLTVYAVLDGERNYYLTDEFGQGITDFTDVLVNTGIRGNTIHHNKLTYSDGYTPKAGYAGTRSFNIKEKDYVRMTFNVFPGKTYYLFTDDPGREGDDDAPLGVTGFYFEPYVFRPEVNYQKATSGDYEFCAFSLNDENYESYWRDKDDARYDVDFTEVEMNDNSAYTFPLSDEVMNAHKYGDDESYANKAVKIRLQRGTFRANKWNSICLPFSMSAVQLENVFGKGTQVVLLRDVTKGYNHTSRTFANFIRHSNQDILAGYPYLILPTQDVWSTIEAIVYIPNPEQANAITQNSIVSISGLGPKTQLYEIPQGERNTSLYNYVTENGKTYECYRPITGEALGCYTFKGTLEAVDVQEGWYAMSGTGNLTRITATQAANGVKVKPYRAYLQNTNVALSHALSATTFFAMPETEEDAPTDIPPIEIDGEYSEEDGIMAGSRADGIYDMLGRKVNASQLKKGVYIINGRKFAF